MYTDGLIHRDTTATPQKGIEIADIQQAVGRGANDIGQLASDQEWYDTGEVDQQGNPVMALRDAGRLNPYAKYKPYDYPPNPLVPAYMMQLPDSFRAQHMWGLTIPALTNPKNLFDEEFEYTKPTDWFRFADFGSSEYPDSMGYFNKAQPTMCCVTPDGSQLEYNAINENAQAVSFLFYVYSRYGSRNNNFLYARLCEANKAISDMGDCTFGSATLRNCVIAIEDLVVNNIQFIGNDETRFGVALFKDGIKNGYKGCLFCNTPLGYRGTSVTDMCGLNSALPSSTYPVGDYVAIPFITNGNTVPDSLDQAQQNEGDTTYFFPLPKYPTFGGIHKVNVKVGSTERYEVAFVGVAETDSGTPVATLTLQTIQNSVYMFVDITNLSDRLHQTGVATRENWILKTKVNGSVVTRAGDTPTTLTNVEHTSYNSSNFHIPSSGTTRLPFLVSKIWNTDPSQPATTTISGIITISPELYYQSEKFTNIDMGHTLPTITVKFNWSS